MRGRPLACLMLLLFLVLQVIPADDMQKSAEITEKCKGQVTGTVAFREQQEDKCRLTLTGCCIKSGTSIKKVKKILVYLTDETEYPVGAVLSLSGTIYPIEIKRNPGQFDSRLYYGARNISCTVYAETATIQFIHPAPVRECLLGLKQCMAQVYEKTADEKTCGLLKSMILGEKSSLNPDIKELYQENGISHILAISGLHVSLIGLGLYGILKKLTGRTMLPGMVVIGVLLAYGWMTGASVSTIRAVLMCMLAILSEFAGRTYDMLTAMGISGLLIVCRMPLQVRQSSFLLSFGAVLAIALMVPVWKLYGIFQGKIGQSLGVSLAVLLVTFPVLLESFYQYPPYSVLLNLLVIPLMTVVMAAGIFCGFAGMICLPAGKAAAFVCSCIFQLYERAGTWILSLPGSVLTIGEPAKWKVVIYGMILSGCLAVWYREKRKKKYSANPKKYVPDRRVLAVTTIILLLGIGMFCVRKRDTYFTITMLDVGQGDGIFMKSPDGTTFLVDGGSSSVSSVGAYRIIPFLKSQGYESLDYLLISHMDKDHISGIGELVEKDIRIETAILPEMKNKDEAYEELEQTLNNAGTEILYMGAGDRLASETLEFTCLWPEKELSWEDRNECSMVIIAEYGEFQMIFTGDIGEKAEARLVEKGVLEDVEVLKTAHHGSRYSSTEAFLCEVKPEVSLISCSASNRYGHPGEETLERLQNAGSKIFITRDSGAITVRTDGHKVSVSSYLEP